MKARKNFVGPQLRQIRREHKQTQVEMARALGVSAAYVNLLENNQRALSVQVLMKLSEVYGVDWRDVVADDGPNRLADLRTVFEDPLFAEPPDIAELRGLLDHAPAVGEGLLVLHKAYRALAERLVAATDGDSERVVRLTGRSPEAAVHDLFRRHRNHFEALEELAADVSDPSVEPAELYAYLKRRLDHRHGVSVESVPVGTMGSSLRYYDESEERVLLSDALDYPNRVFQLAHVVGLIEGRRAVRDLLRTEGVGEPAATRCRVELTNYFAAAVLMPYDAVRAEAERTGYDLDLLALRFGVSFEQVCHRLTTLQRDGAQGVPFFFLRIDRAGNVVKRFNATPFQLAEYGGACPRLDIHLCFRMAGRLMTQIVEMPDGSRYFTINRTVERPSLGPAGPDRRLAVTLGCAVEHARDLVYARGLSLSAPEAATAIGINCRLCPRIACAERAHQPLHLELPMDANRRGETRFEN